MRDCPEIFKVFLFCHKKVIGKMNDEVKRKMISEFVELKSKMYSLVIANSKEIKKTKDIDKNIVKNTHKKNTLMFCLTKF